MASSKTLSQLLEQDHISNGDVRYASEDLKAELVTLTANCVGTLRERFFWLQQGLSDYPTCATCYRPLSSKNFRTNSAGGHYTTTCCVKCAKRNPHFADAQRKTVMEKYGAAQYLGSADARAKIVTTNVERYGTPVAAPWYSDINKAAMREKYGVDNVYQLDAVREKSSASLIETNVLTGKTEMSIRSCQAARNALCVNVELALDTKRDLLETIPLRWKHLSCGNEYTSAISDGTIKVCPHCHSGASVLELSLRQLVLSESDDPAEFNVRGVLPGNLELDIYIPSKKIAFEFNGIYWHSALRNADRNKHLVKTELCEQLGIKLIHVWEHQFMQKFDVVRSVIANALGKSTQIYARKCEVREVPSKEANAFLTASHLNGYVRAKYNLGLYHNATLVAVMSFGKKRFGRNTEDGAWEIYRFATSVGLQIPGGASRLFKHFIKLKSPRSVMSFADKSLGGGEVYLHIGMTEEKSTPPSYFWANTLVATHLSRYKTQKHRLKELLGDHFDPEKSEGENMRRLGWFKIWDCGNRKFSWHSGEFDLA